MRFDEELKTAFKEETKDWNAPTELKAKILNQVLPTRGGRRMKKWVVACILAAVLVIPTGVYAGYNYMADSIYGSQENIAQFGVTQEKYDELEAKLQNAKHNLSEEEYTKWMSLLKAWAAIQMKATDANGETDLKRLSAEEQENYKRVTTELEPFFSKLNEVQSSKKQVKLVDRDTFWNEQLNRARQLFSKEQFSEFQNIINQLKEYDDKATDSDGSIHLERLSEEDQTNIDQLVQQLEPYINMLDITVKPRS